MQTHHFLLLLLHLSVSVFGQNDYGRPFLQNDNSPDYLQERTLSLNDKSEEYDYGYDTEEDSSSSSYSVPDSPSPKEEKSPSYPNSLNRRPHCSSVRRTIPHDKYCDKYYLTTECEEDGALLRSCPNGLSYAGSDRFGLIDVCDYPHNVNCRGKEMNRVLSERVIQQQDPCQAKNLITSDVDYCDRYWECLDGQAELYDCPNGLVWVGRNRGIADGCDYPWRNPSLCQDKDLANPPISTEHCDWLYGIFGHETSCTRYWTCWNGTATEQFCVGGLLYNEETHACDWPQNVLGCQKHPLCKDDANGNVPLGKSCNRYWACQGGYPRLQRCPAMLVFDKIRKRCVSPPTADCDIPATTPAPVPHIGEAAVSKVKSLKRSGVRRRNGGGASPQRNAPIPIQSVSPNDELSNSLSGAEPAFSIPQGATLIGSSEES